ncbi:MAG: S24 family peptidase [Polaromonas sp.]|nr:S24 family peptidase [Polaromonas sp.]
MLSSRLEPSLDQTPQPLAPGLPAAQLRLISHRLSAGFPSPAADYTEEALNLNDYLVRNKPATFMFTVKGDSMTHAGIHHEDKVVVDRSLTPQSGDIVVAVVNSDYTIKRLRYRQGQPELWPENPSYAPITFAEGAELEIWGVVVGVVRRLTTRG